MTRLQMLSSAMWHITFNKYTLCTYKLPWYMCKSNFIYKTSRKLQPPTAQIFVKFICTYSTLKELY